jgi:predicted metal-dependent phosphotriesterase family hydrolase
MTLPSDPFHPKLRLIQTVTGPISYGDLGMTDAHNHVWIEKVPGSGPSSPVLADREGILKDLTAYYKAGGRSLLDCQPGGCGRNGRMLISLSMDSGVHIIACTGFHRRKYYPPDYWLWSASPEAVEASLSAELSSGLLETRDELQPVRAGFIKLALEASFEDTPLALLEGAACAAEQSGAMVELHTEKGAAATEALQFFSRKGVSPRQVVLCHMDKRPDFGLHCELAQSGALLEYDTFFRPKYEPENNLWPLIHRMVSAGYSHALALATDMAESEYYANLGGGPGLASLPTQILFRLKQEGYPEMARSQMLGNNIASRLARLS